MMLVEIVAHVAHQNKTEEDKMEGKKSKPLYILEYSYGRDGEGGLIEYSTLTNCFWLSNKEGERISILGEEMKEIINIIKDNELI